jgi:hypothetical protein
MPDGRRGAGQPVIQADGRLRETHAGRAPSIKRRSLTPSPLAVFTAARVRKTKTKEKAKP